VPSVSKKQHNFMAAVSKNPEFAKKAGVPQSVGEDYIKADKRKSFSGNPDKQAIAKKKTNQGAMELFKGGGMATSAKMKMQKDMKKEFPQGISKKGTVPESQSMGMMGMKKGGAACTPMKKGGMPKKMAKGGGVESKGKTKGKMC